MNPNYILDKEPVMKRPLELHVYESSIQLGHSSIDRIGRNIAATGMMTIATKQLPTLESLMKCIEMNWMPILVSAFYVLFSEINFKAKHSNNWVLCRPGESLIV